MASPFNFGEIFAQSFQSAAERRQRLEMFQQEQSEVQRANRVREDLTRQQLLETIRANKVQEELSQAGVDIQREDLGMRRDAFELEQEVVRPFEAFEGLLPKKIAQMGIRRADWGNYTNLIAQMLPKIESREERLRADMLQLQFDQQLKMLEAEKMAPLLAMRAEQSGAYDEAKWLVGREGRQGKGVSYLGLPNFEMTGEVLGASGNSFISWVGKQQAKLGRWFGSKLFKTDPDRSAKSLFGAVKMQARDDHKALQNLARDWQAIVETGDYAAMKTAYRVYQPAFQNLAKRIADNGALASAIDKNFNNKLYGKLLSSQPQDLKNATLLAAHNMAAMSAFDEGVRQYAAALDLPPETGFLEGAVSRIFDEAVTDKDFDVALKAAGLLKE